MYFQFKVISPPRRSGVAVRVSDCTAAGERGPKGRHICAPARPNTCERPPKMRSPDEVLRGHYFLGWHSGLLALKVANQSRAEFETLAFSHSRLLAFSALFVT